MSTINMKRTKGYFPPGGINNDDNNEDNDEGYFPQQLS